jgi:N utilization substance protein B
MSRKTAREHAFRVLFSAQFQQESAQVLIERYLQGQETTLDEKDKNFVYRELEGALREQKHIYARIEEALKEWKLSRLYRVDRAILQIAVYEMLYEEDIPESVSINEAVELAKKYSTEAAPAFINGVLGTIAKTLEEES